VSAAKIEAPLALLEAENHALREAAVTSPRRRRAIGRTVGAVVMILIDERSVQAFVAAEGSDAVITAVVPNATVTRALGALVVYDAPGSS